MATIRGLKARHNSGHVLYFSEDAALDGAGAAGAAAGASALFAPEASPLSPLAAGFADPYPSAYHPPPFSENAGAVITRLTAPPQCGQVVISGSENF